MDKVIRFGEITADPTISDVLKRIAEVPRDLLEGRSRFVEWSGTAAHVTHPFAGPTLPEAESFIVKLSGFGSGVRGHHVLSAQAVAEAVGRR